MPTVTRNLFRKQIEFVTAPERFVLQSGGFGSGKSEALCVSLVRRAAVKGAREGLTRKSLESLKKSTLKTLLDGDGARPSVLPPGSYTHNKGEKTIKIHGGGEILYFGMDDPGKLGSLNLSGIAVDELIQFTEADWTWMLGRVRVRIAGLPNQIYGATNPGPPSHWIADKFGLALGKVAHSGYRAIRTKTTDNPHLPPDYVASVNALTGVQHRRFFLGEWAGADGLVYDTFDREKHVMARHGPWARTVIGVDVGYTNPFAALLVHVDGDGRVHIAAEEYQSKLMPDEQCSRIAGLVAMADTEPEAVLIDPSEPQLIQLVRGIGHNARPADNAIESGTHRVRNRLRDPGDGRPRLTVDPSCENVIREFESYEFEAKSEKDRTPDSDMKDKPKKKFDHAMDALRYAIAYIDPPQGVFDLIRAGGDGGSELQVTLTSDYGWEECR